jgi:hypothetical protein
MGTARHDPIPPQEKDLVRRDVKHVFSISRINAVGLAELFAQSSMVQPSPYSIG